MAFRIPITSLSTYQQNQIIKDLTFHQKNVNKKYAQKPKKIVFYSSEDNDILLPMYYASKLFKIPVINKMNKYPEIPVFKFIGKLRDYQEEIVNSAILLFKKNGGVFLNVFCAFGKTVVGSYFSAMINKQHKFMTLILYPRVMIGKSWIGTYKKFTDAKIHVVGEYLEYDKDTQIILCMNKRVLDIPKSIRKKIGLLIIDEADMFCTNGNVAGILSVEPMYIVILTATYERDDGFHVMLDQLVGTEKITKISNKPFFILKLETKFWVEPDQGKHDIIWNSVIEKLDNIEERNKLIIDIVLNNLDQKILILTKHKLHAINLYTKLKPLLNEHMLGISLIIGNINEYVDGQVIIGTFSKIGVGFDESETCIDWKGIRLNMLILASTTRKIEQFAGRVLRSDVPVIIDIVDNMSYMQNHWKLRSKYYLPRNGFTYKIKKKIIWKNLLPRLLSTYKTDTPIQTPDFLHSHNSISSYLFNKSTLHLPPPIPEITSSTSHLHPPILDITSSTLHLPPPIPEITSSTSHLHPFILDITSSTLHLPPPIPEITSSTSHLPPPILDITSSTLHLPPPIPEITSSTSHLHPPILDITSSTLHFQHPILNINSSTLQIPPPIPDITLSTLHFQHLILNINSSTLQIPPPILDITSSTLQIPPPIPDITSSTLHFQHPILNINISDLQIPLPILNINISDLHVPPPILDITSSTLHFQHPIIDINISDLHVPPPILDITSSTLHFQHPIIDINISDLQISLPIPDINISDLQVPPPI